MHDPETYTLIERYWAGECTPEEVAVYEKRLASDPEFAELAALHRDLDATLADADALAFSAELAAADQAYHQTLETQSTPTKVRRLSWQRWAIAASIVVLAVVGGIFLLRDRSLTGPEAFEAYFVVYDAPADFRSDSAVIGPLYSTAFEAYQKKDWQGAVVGFEAIESRDSSQITARFYLAVSLLASGDADGAIARLEWLTRAQHPFTTQSKWYLAMAWLQKGDVAAAKRILEELAQGQGKYRGLAEKLLKRLPGL